ncbi:hypothetical protein QBO93_002983 [Citrobacter freundii]|nr:hypothetical protein [Citrobacter freundii]
MTTNNHPANCPVSLERLHQIRETLSKAAAQSDGGNLGYAMADAVKVIDGAIASFGAEPVGTFRKGPCGYYPSFHEDAVTLYAAPPVPVVPEEKLDEDGNTTSEFDHGWNACRSAMLQADNHTEQHLDMVDHSGDDNEKSDCKLPFDQWLSQQNEPIDVDCGCVTSEAFYHWLRVAYEAGNSPATPDGWRVEAERLAEMHGCSFVVFRNGEEPQCADPTKVIISFTDKGLGHHSSAPQSEVKCG